MNNNVNIKNLNGTTAVSSRQIAEDFEKEHGKVIRAIENILNSEPRQNWLRYFIASEYKDSKGEMRKEYLCTGMASRCWQWASRDKKPSSGS